MLRLWGGRRSTWRGPPQRAAGLMASAPMISELAKSRALWRAQSVSRSEFIRSMYAWKMAISSEELSKSFASIIASHMGDLRTYHLNGGWVLGYVGIRLYARDQCIASGYVRLWHKADIPPALTNVRYGVKRTWGERAVMSANDPKRTFPSRRFLVVLRCDQFRPNGFGTSVQTSRKK